MKVDHTINKKKPIWKQRIEKEVPSLKNDISRTNDWFKGRWKEDNTNKIELLRTTKKPYMKSQIEK